jgi:hypothetical protein
LANSPNFREAIDYNWIALFFTTSKRVSKSILSLKIFMGMWGMSGATSIERSEVGK